MLPVRGRPVGVRSPAPRLDHALKGEVRCPGLRWGTGGGGQPRGRNLQRYNGQAVVGRLITRLLSPEQLENFAKMLLWDLWH